jgi:hypothetical protein
MVLPNRIALYLTAAAGLLGALAPIVADLDWTSTVGIAAGLAAITGVVYKWLDGWQKYEERTALEPLVEEQLGANIVPPGGPPPVEGGPRSVPPS